MHSDLILLIHLEFVVLKELFGIGTFEPASKLDVEGNVTIGSSYSGFYPASSNGLILLKTVCAIINILRTS